MKPIVLFGVGKIAEVLLHFFKNSSDREVVACTVDRQYVTTTVWNGLPVVAFEDILQTYPPDAYDLFVALGYQDMNSLREAKCQSARELGYTLPSLVHPDSGLPSDCVYGDNCFVMNHVHVHPRVRFGNNVFVWSGAVVGHHSTIGDNCWLTSSASVSGVVSMGKNCFLAVNATVGHGIEIADHCFIGANALVVKSTKAGETFLAESTKAFRLNSRQFLRMSKFDDV